MLLAMVKAGADVYTRGKFGYTVSEVARYYTHTGLWVKVLKTCGYDPETVLAYGNGEIELREGRDEPDVSGTMSSDEKMSSEEEMSNDEEMNIDEEMSIDEV